LKEKERRETVDFIPEYSRKKKKKKKSPFGDNTSILPFLF